MKLNKILVPLDGSALAEAALPKAASSGSLFPRLAVIGETGEVTSPRPEARPPQLSFSTLGPPFRSLLISKHSYS
jgi:hypothetical protein